MAIELEIQKFLRTDEHALDILKGAPYSLVIQEHEDGRVMFNYDQIESAKHLEICKEARGLILDKNNNWDIVSLGFRRFFNAGESEADNIDFTKSYALEKVDGSMILCYFYKNAWRYSTRGSIDASGSVGDFPFTFAELIKKAVPEKMLEYLWKEQNSLSDITFIFELTSPYNRVVTPYNQTQLYLIGARNKDWGHDYNYETLLKVSKFLGVKIPKRLDLRSLEEIAAAANSLRPYEEGFVVVYEREEMWPNLRVKVKNISYVALHHIKSANSSKNLVAIIQKGEKDEVIANLPEFKELLEIIEKEYLYLLGYLNSSYIDCLRGIENIEDLKEKKKQFALKAKNYKCNNYLFNKFNSLHKLNFEDMLRNERPDKLAEILGVKELKMEQFKIKNNIDLE